ncbi:MAG: conjugal transfer protein TraF [Proteobacteria bacterium]|nr:conjugal transfer protein TraF [Pseudomonadota bacterium]
MAMFCSNKTEDRKNTLWICIIFLAVCIFSHSTNVCARESQKREGTVSKVLHPNNDKVFYDDRQRGWYWFDAGNKIKKKETTPSTEFSITQPPSNGSSKYSYNEMWVMYPDDFKAYSSRVTKQAVQFPTEENIKHYLEVMDVTRRKSAAFTAAVNYVAQKNALYTREDTHPITAPGLTVMKDIRYQEIDTLIRNSRREFALIMFTQPGCGFCNAQIDILSFFEESYGWPLRMVNIKENPAAGARFGVEQTPSIILVHKDTKDYMRISSGVISLSKLKLRLYRSIRMMKNEILPEQWGTYDFEKGTGGDPLKFVDIDNRFNSSKK